MNLVPLLDMKGGDSKPAMGGGGSGGNAAGGGNGGRLFSDDPLPLDGLNAVDAVLSYKAADFKAPKLEAKNLAVSLTLKDGALNVKPFALDAAGGHADRKSTRLNSSH